MQEHFKDTNKMQEVLHEAQTGLWVIEIDPDEQPRMYADSAMLELLGLNTEVSPEECYNHWYENIDHDYYSLVQAGVDKMISDNRAEVQYPWQHPVWGQIYVRCGGVIDRNYKGGICLRGYHQNITNTVILKQEYDAVIQSLSDNYTAIMLCNLKDKSFKVIKMPEHLLKFPEPFTDCEKMLEYYAEHEVDSLYRDQVLKALDLDTLRMYLENGEKPAELFYRKKEDGYRKIKIVPAATYSKENPLVIVAFDEQSREVEKRLDDTAAKTAVSQIYKLVVSVNLDRGEYNCIHYGGTLLTVKRQGRFEEFISQLLNRMPAEDKQLFWTIFNMDNYAKTEYQEGIMRLYGKEKELLYYRFYSTCITQGIEKRIILTIRNLDAGQEIAKRENVLSKLCQCYYSIYLFDLENDIEEAIWQEEMIYKHQEFPKGSLAVYYEKFICNHVYEEDQGKMRKAGSPEFLRQTLSAENPVYDIDFRRVYPDSLQWIRSRFSIAEIRDGVVTKVVFANMNIHEQKTQEIEEDRQKKDALYSAYEAANKANEAKSRFLAQMSHDIRTPMNAIMGMAAIADSHIEDAKKVKECLREISVSSHHLLELINEILDMSKIERGKMELAVEPFSLTDVMMSVSSILCSEAAGRKHHMNIEYEGITHDHLIGDAGKIKQMLLNLGTNAVKYTPSGGTVNVKVVELSEKMPGQGCYVFTVEDNGIGMDPEFLEHVFVPFARADDARVRHIQGTGLGMSIAWNIVSAMGGDIQVESQKGVGTRFTVTLHLEIAPEDNKICTEEGDQESLDAWAFPKGTRILIAEDNKLNMEIARTILEEEGILVDGAENGKEVLEKFLHSEPFTYQAILMDLQMPVMDGVSATREIRGSSHPQAKRIPIIALTANAFAEDIAKSLAAGMNDHVSKPIDYEHLLKVVSVSISEGQEK